MHRLSAQNGVSSLKQAAANFVASYAPIWPFPFVKMAFQGYTKMTRYKDGGWLGKFFLTV